MAKKDAPIPAGGMVRSGGKLVARRLQDMPDNEPIRKMADKGRGLETVPDTKPKLKLNVPGAINNIRKSRSKIDEAEAKALGMNKGGVVKGKAPRKKC